MMKKMKLKFWILIGLITGFVICSSICILNNDHRPQPKENVEITDTTLNNDLLCYINETIGSNNDLYIQLLNNTNKLKKENCTDEEIYFLNTAYIIYFTINSSNTNMFF